MDLVWDDHRQSIFINELTDCGDLSLQDHRHPVGHEQPMHMNAPPPSPQEPSMLDTVFAKSLSTRSRSDTILVNDRQGPIGTHQHAHMLDQLLRQAASRCNGRRRGSEKPSERDLKKTSATVALKRRKTPRVEKPSRIPITSSRVRARAALHKATSDLADAIAMVHLSSSLQVKKNNNGD